MAEPTSPGRVSEDGGDTGRGPGLVLVVVYATLALAATGRSVLQITEYFDRAPLAYLLSAVAAVVYVVATFALLTDRRRLARTTIAVEALGVLAVGALSYVATDLFPDKTVWSHLGSGYAYLPLVLPFVGLWWVARQDARDRATI